MPDVIACGEMLIDFVSTVSGVTLMEAPAFEKAPGGAPANVAVGLARLGVSTGFIGKLGEDEFGRFLQSVLDGNGVDTSRLLFTEEARTALAFVSLREDGEREFMFYRHPSADMLFAPHEVHVPYIARARVFHYGSITLGAEPSASATLHAAIVARENGLFVSYDPNLRLNLWPSAEAAREGMMRGWEHANLIKISEEEATFLTGTDDLEQAARDLWHDNLRLLAVTQGSEGSTVFTPSMSIYVPGFPVRAVDTTGAGDAFLAGLLFSLFPNLDHLMRGNLDETELIQAVRFANAAGALTTTRRGAIPALPTLEEVRALLARGG
ncbi:MAG: PfkB family carbohydrate kinase [Chloroflexota bacterium]|nr:PfkB family carbohydrate kinase [Chloroflexota bacterium]MDQ5867341.1 PfkB family carbohydrate kinase [Chloroflexota bacterium]